MSKFGDLKKEMREEIIKGEKKRNHSKTDFNKFTKAFVNDVDFTTHKVKGVDEAGKVIKDEVKPVEEYRKGLKKILIDFGVDKQEAEKIMKEYEIKSVDGLYEFISELMYEYMDTGKKFSFLPKEDFTGTMWLDDVEADTDWQEYRNPSKPGEFIYSKRDKHKVLNRKSSCPNWLKTKK